jgi:hypothetical protein
MKIKKVHIEQLPKKNIFLVPENYFYQLPLDIQTKIKNEIWQIKMKENIFGVPTAYFEELNQNILAKTTQKNVLSQFEKENIFEVPENYFDTLSQKIKNKINQPPKTENVFIWTNSKRLAFVCLIITLFYFSTKLFVEKEQKNDNPVAIKQQKTKKIISHQKEEKELVKITQEESLKNKNNQNQKLNVNYLENTTKKEEKIKENISIQDVQEYLATQNISTQEIAEMLDEQQATTEEFALQMEYEEQIINHEIAEVTEENWKELKEILQNKEEK